MCLASVLLYSVSITFILAADPPLETLAEKNCRDSHATLDSFCWETLGLRDYLHTWNQTAKVCATSAATGSYYTLGEPWTTCFLRLHQPSSGTDYTQINSCAFSPSLPVLPPKPPQKLITSSITYVVCCLG